MRPILVASLFYGSVYVHRVVALVGIISTLCMSICLVDLPHLDKLMSRCCNFKSYQNESISICVILTRHLDINLSRFGRSTKQIDKRKVEMMPTKATTRCTYTLP